MPTFTDVTSSFRYLHPQGARIYHYWMFKSSHALIWLIVMPDLTTIENDLVQFYVLLRVGGLSGLLVADLTATAVHQEAKT